MVEVTGYYDGKMVEVTGYCDGKMAEVTVCYDGKTVEVTVCNGAYGTVAVATVGRDAICVDYSIT